MPRPLVRIERRGLVRDGELLTEAGKLVSIDGDLYALFEGRRVKVTVEVDHHAESTDPDRARGSGSV